MSIDGGTMAYRLLLAAALIPTAMMSPIATANAEPYYENCAAARDAGVAPLREDDPGYAPHLDRDRDGIACE
jgi:hypothetical protein